jgi:hypothetical protein
MDITSLLSWAMVLMRFRGLTPSEVALVLALVFSWTTLGIYTVFFFIGP